MSGGGWRAALDVSGCRETWSPSWGGLLFLGVLGLERVPRTVWEWGLLIMFWDMELGVKRVWGGDWMGIVEGGFDVGGCLSIRNG